MDHATCHIYSYVIKCIILCHRDEVSLNRYSDVLITTLDIPSSYDFTSHHILSFHTLSLCAFTKTITLFFTIYILQSTSFHLFFNYYYFTHFSIIHSIYLSSIMIISLFSIPICHFSIFFISSIFIFFTFILNLFSHRFLFFQ